MCWDRIVEHDGPAGAHEEGDAELGLERGDALRQRGLRDEQRSRRPREAAVVGGHDGTDDGASPACAIFCAGTLAATGYTMIPRLTKKLFRTSPGMFCEFSSGKTRNAAMIRGKLIAIELTTPPMLLTTSTAFT